MPADVEPLDDRGRVLRRYELEGWTLLGMSWLPEIADETMTSADAEAVFSRLQELLNVRIDIKFCPHPAGPPICWCRKPLPGLGVTFIERYRLDPPACIYVGSSPQDRSFARRLGFGYRDDAEFFSM